MTVCQGTFCYLLNNLEWTPDTSECSGGGGCSALAIPRPAPQTIASDGQSPWSMDVEVSDNDGLVLRNIKLNDRYMAEEISVPYYTLETSALPGRNRGELKPDSGDASMKSRLINYYVMTDNEKRVIEATYAISQIPAGSRSCLQITQRYEFYKPKEGDNCEPSATLPCARWKPIVKYNFWGNGIETLNSINIVQRQHLTVDNNPYNSVGLFRDNDYPLDVLMTGLDKFARRCNPLPLTS